MAHNTIVLKIFKDKSNLDDFSVYICSMTEKIIDIKNKILKDIFQRLPVGLFPDAEPLDLMQADGACERLPTQFNYLDFENISERVYKDYGKLFFEKGLLPRTIDNYSLQDFTIEGRDFSFLCIPTIFCEKPKLTRNNYINNDLCKTARIESTYGSLSQAPSACSKSTRNHKKEYYQQKKINSFVFNEDDFPPLK